MVDEKLLACILATAIDLDRQLEILQNFIKSFNSRIQPRDFMAKDSRCNREATIEAVEEGVEIGLHEWEFLMRIKTIDNDDHNDVIELRGILEDANWKVVESIIGSTVTIEREGVTSLCGHFTGEELLILGIDQPTIPFTTIVGEEEIKKKLEELIGDEFGHGAYLTSIVNVDYKR
ncbi:hypothetical protein ACLOJK_031298 [Asimina triloba]